MAPNQLLATMTVTDLESAVAWYTRLFGSEPHARPMDGLVEWRFTSALGVQVWADPERSGRSGMVLGESDLDALAARLTAEEIEHDGVQDATESRILMVKDPDGNNIVFTGPLRS